MLNRTDTLVDELTADITNTPPPATAVDGDERWPPRFAVWRICAGPPSWRTTTSCPRSRTLPTTSGIRWRYRGGRRGTGGHHRSADLMAVTAKKKKKFSPAQTVLIPAGCSLPIRITPDELRAWRTAVVASYVNTTAAVKALTDICCTSSNAVDVVRIHDPGPRGVVLVWTTSVHTCAG